MSSATSLPLRALPRNTSPRSIRASTALGKARLSLKSVRNQALSQILRVAICRVLHIVQGREPLQHAPRRLSRRVEPSGE
jgi:hypothetical protein